MTTAPHPLAGIAAVAQEATGRTGFRPTWIRKLDADRTEEAIRASEQGWILLAGELVMPKTAGDLALNASPVIHGEGCSPDGTSGWLIQPGGARVAIEESDKAPGLSEEWIPVIAEPARLLSDDFSKVWHYSIYWGHDTGGQSRLKRIAYRLAGIKDPEVTG